MITELLLFTQLVLASNDTTGFSNGNGTVDLPITINESITVEAIRADEKTPVSQKTLSKTEISKANFGQEMPFQLSKTPAILFQSDGGSYTGYSYMRLRGIDQTRINMTLNGMPLNEPEDEGAYFSNYADFMSSVQSVQIQRGVGTSTNGVASYGGSVNFQYKSLTDSINQIEFGYGSFNSQRYSLSFSSGLMNHGFSGYFRVSQLSTDGYRYNSGNKSQSVFTSIGYFGTKDIIQFITFYGNEKCYLAYLATSLDDIKIDPRINYLSPTEQDHFGQGVCQLQYIHQFNDIISLSAQIYGNLLDGNYLIKMADIMPRFNVTSNWVGGTSNLNMIFDNLKIYTGINAYKYSRNHFMDFNPLDYSDVLSDYVYYNTGHKNEKSIFTKILYDINKFTLFGDVQYRIVNFNYDADTHYNLSINPIEWKFVNPRCGINYSLTENADLYSSIGLMHREPTRNDMFAGYDDIDSTNISEIGDLSRVKPEKVVDLEIGTNLHFKNLTIRANLYNMQFSNEIAAIGQLSYIGLPLRKNVPSSYRRGFEIDGTYLLINNLKIQSNIAYIDAHIKEYNTDYDGIYYNIIPLLTPKWISNSSLNFVILPFEFITNERFVSESYLDNQNTLICPSYITIDLGAKIYMSNFSISLQANNIFDKKYYSSGYVVGTSPYYFIQCGRNFFITTMASF